MQRKLRYRNFLVLPWTSIRTDKVSVLPGKNGLRLEGRAAGGKVAAEFPQEYNQSENVRRRAMAGCFSALFNSFPRDPYDLSALGSKQKNWKPSKIKPLMRIGR